MTDKKIVSIEDRIPQLKKRENEKQTDVLSCI